MHPAGAIACRPPAAAIHRSLPPRPSWAHDAPPPSSPFPGSRAKEQRDEQAVAIAADRHRPQRRVQMGDDRHGDDAARGAEPVGVGAAGAAAARRAVPTWPFRTRGEPWPRNAAACTAGAGTTAWAACTDGMHGGMGGGMMFRGSPERMGRMIDHMLDGLNASDAQRSQIKQIAAGAATDLKAQREAGRGAARSAAMQAFTAPTVDAAAVEQVRQQMLQQHDQMSRRVTQAMLDVARVLTPEQRARLGERMRDRQARMEDRMKRMDVDARRESAATPIIVAGRRATPAASAHLDDATPSPRRRRQPPRLDGRRLPRPCRFRGRDRRLAGGRPRPARRQQLRRAGARPDAARRRRPRPVPRGAQREPRRASCRC